MSHHYGHLREKGETVKHYVARRFHPAMVGIATELQAELFHELSDGYRDRCRREFGRRIVQRIFAHVRRGQGLE